MKVTSCILGMMRNNFFYITAKSLEAGYFCRNYVVTEICKNAKYKNTDKKRQIQAKNAPRNIAQPGRASASGAEGREFESRYSDLVSTCR